MAKNRRFWGWVVLALLLRLVLIFFSKKLNFGSRPEIATPLTSLRRLAEGYWLKQSSMSPYAGSMYHSSPLLLSILGPFTVKSVEGLSNHIVCSVEGLKLERLTFFNVLLASIGLICCLFSSLIFVIADFITAMLIRATGQKLQLSYSQSLRSLNLLKLLEDSKIVTAGDVAAVIYLWNPLTIVTCVGSSTSPIENLMVVLSLYGACSGLAPLAAFGWVIATHLSLYPAFLIVPMILLLGYGSDSPPKKLFLLRNFNASGSDSSRCSHNPSSEVTSQPELLAQNFKWKSVVHFILWAFIWSFYVLILCGISLNQHSGLHEMFKKTHGFILTVEDLSPNIGVLWYFFAEVFDFFRVFFLIVFHVNILFMILPLAIRLKHRPFFLAFVYVAISSMLKSYPSVGDTALYLGLLGLFINELADMHFSFFLFCGYVGVALLSPVMHNLWIWRGTGNANFYFATGIAYALLQIILVVESVGAMLNHDRMLRKQLSM